MTNDYTRSDAAERVQAVASGVESLDDLQRWLAAVFVSDEFPGPPQDETLLIRLMFVFEDESVSASDHVANAALVASALQSRISNDRVIQLLPILVGTRRLCEVVEKYRGGVISRTGFLSFLAERRYPAEIKSWLLQATPNDLDSFCTALNTRDLRTVERTLPGTR